MAYRVAFTIDGDPAGGVTAVKKIGDAFDQMAARAAASAARATAAFGNVGAAVGSLRASVGGLKGDIAGLATQQTFKNFVSGIQEARRAAVATARSVRTMADAIRGLGMGGSNPMASMAKGAKAAQQAQQSAAVHAQKMATAAAQTAAAQTRAAVATVRLQQAQGRAAAGAAVATRNTTAWATALRTAEHFASRVLVKMSGIALATGAGARGFGQSISRIGVQGAGSFQSLGIGLRMGGIAFGQQASQLGSQGILGLGKMTAGLASVIAEIGARAATAVGGFVVRVAGTAVSSVLQLIGGSLGGVMQTVFGSLAGSFGKAAGMILQGAGAIISGVTNLAGEVVTQMGNVFTGLAEAARGAFQGVLDVAGGILGKLVDVAGEVVGRVGGVLGTLGKAVFGTGAVVGGFAFRDVLAGDKGIARVNVLLEDKLSPEGRRSLQAWGRNLQREIGGITPALAFDTLERAVSTGFQGDVKGGQRLAATAMKLASVGGDVSIAPTAARVMAKTFSLFKNEFKSADPFAEIADGIQALVNYGDLKLPEIVDRLGEILASGKAVGASFQDTLVLLAQMSQSLGVEQTFTDVRHLLTDPLKFSEEATDLLRSRGIKTSEPTQAEASKIDSLRARLRAAESIAGGKGTLRDAKTNIASLRELTKVRKDEITSEIARLELEKKGAPANKREGIQARINALRDESRAMTTNVDRMAVGTAAYSERLRDAADEAKRLRKELEAAEDAVQKPRNPLALFSEILGAGFSPQQASVLFPNKRALVGYLVQQFQDPGLAKQIATGVRGAKGSVAAGSAIMEDTTGARFSKLWAGLKDPFVATFEAMTPALNRFLDSATAGVQKFGDFWRGVIADPAAASFVERIGGGLEAVFGKTGALSRFFEDPESPARFWEAVNTGLDTFVTYAGKAVTAVTTLVEWLGRLSDKTGATGVLGSLGGMVTQAASWGAGTVGQLSEGKTDNLDAVVSGITGAWRSGIDYVAGVWDSIVAKGESLWQQGKTAFDDVLTRLGGVLDGLKNLGIAWGVFAAGGLLARGGGALAAAGAGARAAAGAGGGAATAGLLASGASRLGRAMRGAGAGYLAGELLPTSGPLGVNPAQLGQAVGYGYAVGGPLGAAAGGVGDLAYQGVREVIDALGESADAEENLNRILSETAQARENERRLIEEASRARRTELESRFAGLELTAQAMALQAADRKRVADAQAIDDAEAAGRRAAQGRVLRQMERGDTGLDTSAFTGVPGRVVPFDAAAKQAQASGIFAKLKAARDAYLKPHVVAPDDAKYLGESGALKAARDTPPKAVIVPKAAVPPREIKGYTYDPTTGVYRSGMKNVGSPFGLATGGVMDGSTYTPESWAKKIQRAEADPKFEGGRWERFTSRGQATSGGSGASAKKGTDLGKAADALGAVDVGRLDAVEGRLNEVLSKLGEKLPGFIEKTEKNASTAQSATERSLTALGEADSKARDRIARLEEIATALEAAAASAGKVGVAEGTN